MVRVEDEEVDGSGFGTKETGLMSVASSVSNSSGLPMLTH